MDAQESFLEGVEQVRRTVGVDSVEVIAGEDDILMVHPSTGKTIKVGANPTKVLKFLLKGFILVLNRETGLRVKLEVILDPSDEDIEEAEVEEQIEEQLQPKRTTVKTKLVKAKRKNKSRGLVKK